MFPAQRHVTEVLQTGRMPKLSSDEVEIFNSNKAIVLLALGQPEQPQELVAPGRERYRYDPLTGYHEHVGAYRLQGYELHINSWRSVRERTHERRIDAGVSASCVAFRNHIVFVRVSSQFKADTSLTANKE
jgi:hypothetical protein